MKYVTYLILIVFILLNACQDEKKHNILTYYKNGQIKEKYYLTEDSLIDGEYLMFYPNGNLKEKFFYKHGKLEKKGFLYYEDGGVLNSFEYKNGYRNGVTKIFSKEGKITSWFYYINDTVMGPAYSFYEDGGLEGYFFYSVRGFQAFRRMYHNDSTSNLTDGWLLVDWYITEPRDTVFVGDTIESDMRFPHPFDCNPTLFLFANNKLISKSTVGKDTVSVAEDFVLTKEYTGPLELKYTMEMQCRDSTIRDTAVMRFSVLEK